MKIRFRWYDLWIGGYVDRPNQHIYVCPLPCVVISWQYGHSFPYKDFEAYGIRVPEHLKD
jgi:hypothetical protein